MSKDSGLDFETFSSVDLKVHGMAQYMESPDFTVLCAVMHYEDGTRAAFDFVYDKNAAFAALERAIDQHGFIAAHNAPFEIAVLRKLGIAPHVERFIDTAVLARAVGAASKLEAAAPQLLDRDKIELGQDLIRVFSVPTKANGGKPYTKEEIEADPELKRQWREFLTYCGVDAELSFEIMRAFMGKVPVREWDYDGITQAMNEFGWCVDIPLVMEMNRRYKENLQILTDEFMQTYNPGGKLNLRSHPQLKKWCADRGVRAKSFDQQAVPKLIRQVEKKLLDTSLSTGQRDAYTEVLALLRLKQELGGSSLSKLQTILDMVGPGGRLRGQYLHVGAGQTYRTSGRGVQMQNLPRLGAVLGDTDELFLREPDGSDAVHWTNEELAQNLRQCFEAEHPDGQLIVGDFSSVESRGLAYQAGEEWKLDAYRQNRDIYKQLATTYKSFGGVAYEDVTKAQRQAGKVGELACGYGAGAGAVQGFAEKMGIDMDDAEAASIVSDWRAADPEITAYWKQLDTMLHRVMRGGHSESHRLPYGGEVILRVYATPDSLTKQHPGAQSIELVIKTSSGRTWLRRVFHGCYYRGNDVCYYKPSELKSGTLWRARMTTPPHAWYKLYGGKIAGILTQSFCRELFFQSLQYMHKALVGIENVRIVGQFHDEIVLEWWPVAGMNAPTVTSAWWLEDTIAELEWAMTDAGPWLGFPLAADIKHAHRYIK